MEAALSAPVETAPTENTSAEPPKKLNFMELLATLNRSDDMLSDPNFNPEELLGNIREKVDDIKFVKDFFGSRITYYKEIIAEFSAILQSLKNNEERLNAYVLASMKQSDFLKMPGNKFRVDHISFEKFGIDREATADDKIEMPELVEVKRIYSWKKEAVEAAFEAAKLPDDTIASKRVVEYCKFFPNTNVKYKAGVLKEKKESKDGQ